jgi:hypothetical protein
VTEVQVTARPFLGLETLGGGALFDFSVGRRFEIPLHVWASVQPLGLATGRSGGLTPFVALLLAAFDTRSFEIGLGVGGQQVNDPGDDFDINGNLIHPGSGITFAQFARLGDRDGMMVSLRSDIVLFHSEFQLSNVSIHGQLPLRGEIPMWVIANGGGGSTGYALGEVGLRTRTSGDSGAGSTFINVTIGGTSLWSEDPTRRDPLTGSVSRKRTNYSGPSLGFGLEWRI